MLQLDICHVNDIHRKNIQVESTLVTIFKKGIYEKPEVLLDIYHHFGGELDWAYVQLAMREHRLTHKDMALSCMLEVCNCTFEFIFTNLYNSNLIFIASCVLNKGGEIANSVYRAYAQEVEALVAQFKSALNTKDKVLEENDDCLKA